jgi:hypothetical protein
VIEVHGLSRQQVEDTEEYQKDRSPFYQLVIGSDEFSMYFFKVIRIEYSRTGGEKGEYISPETRHQGEKAVENNEGDTNKGEKTPEIFRRLELSVDDIVKKNGDYRCR